MQIEKYFTDLKRQVEVLYDIAGQARKKGLDPKSVVEIPLATSLAGRVAGLISTMYPQLNNPQLINRILELEKEYGKLDPAVCLKIAEEIAKEKFCKFQNLLEGMDAGIRVGLAYTTLGVVSSPLEGYTGFKIGKTNKNTEYISAYYSGPIRSAGGTAAAFSFVIIDYLRELFGYDTFDPTEREVKRFITELYDYHERVTNLQYLPTEAEIEFLASRIPIQVNGEPSETREVSNYKDLKRVETNFIRSGVCLTIGEGLAQKAPKILKMVTKLREKGFKLSGWDFLKDFVEFQKKQKEMKKKDQSSAVYIQDLVAGRPVLGHPSMSGAFRLRYGRARNTGYSSLGISPATMSMLNDFIAVGSQLKIELPTKGCAISSCDSVSGPVVKLKNGSVKLIRSYDEGKKLYNETEEIIYLGDLLVPYGDFANRNHILMPAGYVEQEWWQDLKEKIDLNENIIENMSIYNLDFIQAISLSEKFSVPLHPKFIFFWSQIDYDLFSRLLDWLSYGIIREKIVLPYSKLDKEKFAVGKRALELLGVEHEVTTENVVLSKENSKALFVNLGLDEGIINQQEFLLNEKILELKEKVVRKEKVLEIINSLAKFKIEDKAGTFIGSRMGRPEKAKLRKLVGSPNVLFPVGAEGGRLRSIQEAIQQGSVKADFPIYFCKKCGKDGIYFVCRDCGGECERLNYCPECHQKFSSEKCPEHAKAVGYSSQRIDIKNYFDEAVSRLNLDRAEVPVMIKGVRGTSNKNHIPEHLCKGVLRAIFHLNVNKDGTIRYDATELPITHFKPREIEAPIEKLKELGYTRDMYGNELKNDEQILEIFPHDIILPCCPDSPDERADEVFMNIAGFIDSLLMRFYGLKSFYNIRERNDLIGQALACMAPHNCAAVVARIIGFSKTQGFLASPYMHAAMRRDCLGYNSYIPVKDPNGWKIEKIGDFVDNLCPKEKADNFGTLKKRVENFSCWSNPGKADIKEITKHPPREMIKLTLEDGRKIELTEGHRVYLKGKKEKIAGDLREGDKLSVSYKKDIEERDIDELFLPEIFKGKENIMLRNIRQFLERFAKLDKSSNYYQRDSFPIKFVEDFLLKSGMTLRDLPLDAKIAAKRDNVSIPIKIILDKELLEIFGLYIAEGFSRSIKGEKGLNQVYIASNEKELREFVKKVFMSHFRLKPSENKEDRVTFSSRIIYELFTDYLGMGSIAKEKRIPSIFLDLKKDKIAHLLRGYYEGDGSVSSSDIRVTCDTISEGLKHDLSFVLSRFGIFTKFYEYEKESGPKVKEFYVKKMREIPKFKITKITIPSDFVKKFWEIGFLSERKNNILKELCGKEPTGMRIEFDENYVYPQVRKIERVGEKESYCFNVLEEHNFFANDILVHNCDGDEAAIMLLLDILLNFSREYLPAHRGGTQDAPLVLNTKISAGEVDDMIFDLDVVRELPNKLYKAGRRKESPYTIKIEQVRDRLGGKEFQKIDYDYEVSDINDGALCSSYKKLVTMKEKVEKQMELVTKIRAANTSDVARLIIDRHFIRDIRGNLRKFSQQQFRCVKCNQKYRRVPLKGSCMECGSRLIFTISKGSILKYMEPAISLAENFDVPDYIKENLELTKSYIESIFGRDKEKQQALQQWF